MNEPLSGELWGRFGFHSASDHVERDQAEQHQEVRDERAWIWSKRERDPAACISVYAIPQ